ncbi:unnamed protein product, partial [Prunus brigantina]
RERERERERENGTERERWRWGEMGRTTTWKGGDGLIPSWTGVNFSKTERGLG